MTKEAGGVENAEPLRRQWWRESPEERRALLMPFLWGTVAKKGRLWGNRAKGHPMRVTNPHHFSYPGYSEMVQGFSDPRIDSNAKRPNPNETVLEWLNRKPDFHGKVAAFGAWDVVPYICNRERCGFYVNAAYEPVTRGKISPRQALLNQLKAEMTRPWDWGPYDSIVVHSALEYVKANRPRVLWVTLGETDEWAHERRYDRYLQSARGTDQCLQTVWETLQSLPEYRGRTTLLVGVDHGRGRAAQDWTSHGAKHPGSDEVWLAGIGPGIPPMGEVTNLAEVRQSQIAATVAALLGENYQYAAPQADSWIAEIAPDWKALSRDAPR
jgi:hypothetical protein